MSKGAELITNERIRQVKEEGWTAEHDQYYTEELVMAAVCYAMPDVLFKRFWPWALEWWKPTPNNRIRELTKAGALIAAEIDRLIADDEGRGNNGKGAY